ncbi:MAG: dephospho-CoA kinase [Paludisphaera borealis]|uniref:dephospho-CoA kinase n=1 Tax=Paludisphaera borealis TaxID=1387353 RepID=UPI0028497AA5|nr:dephospho-CoA kinase [Paludisphaera borealis]MDR3621952.1 dephospho-CoA kinase [Paludisphaera borealis]
MFETSAITVPPTPERRSRWKHGAIPVIGVIGGIGGGKSAAAALLAERGAVVIDADAVGHGVLQRPEIQERLVARFGSEIIAARDLGVEVGPKIDRRALGKIVFADESARRDLEAIVHPVMIEEFERTIAEAQRSGSAIAVALDAAVLLEAGWDGACDLVVYVDAPRAVRLARVERTRGWSRADFEAREASQQSCDVKRRRADYVLPNVAGPDELAAEVDRFREWLTASTDHADARRPSPSPDPSGGRAGAT